MQGIALLLEKANFNNSEIFQKHLANITEL